MAHGDPEALNADAATFGPEYRSMFSYYSDGTAAVDSAFVPFRPEPFVR